MPGLIISQFKINLAIVQEIFWGWIFYEQKIQIKLISVFKKILESFLQTNNMNFFLVIKLDERAFLVYKFVLAIVLEVIKVLNRLQRNIYKLRK